MMPSLSARTEGALYLILIAVLVALTFFWPVSRLIVNSTALSDTRQQIERLNGAVSAPTPSQDVSAYRSFLAESDKTILPEAFRAQISTLIQQNGLQLIRLDPVRVVTVAEGLNRHTTTLEVGGYMREMSALIAILGTLEQPVLIRKLVVKSKASQSLNATIEIDVWYRVDR